MNPQQESNGVACGGADQMQEKSATGAPRRKRKASGRRRVDWQKLVAQMMETSPVGVMLVGRQGDIISANGRAERILGLRKGDNHAYDPPLWRFTDEAGTPITDQDTPFQRALRSGQPVRGASCHIEWPDGRRTLLSIHATPLSDGSGRVDGVVATIEDITEQRRAQDALRASEHRYRQLLAAVTTYTYSVEVQDGRPVSTQHSWGCISATGYRPHDYASDPDLWIDMVHPDDRAAVRRQVAKVLAGERVPPLEHRILHKDGTIRWVRDTIVQHFDEGGALVRYDGLVEEITERKKVEERVRRLLESAPDATVIADRDGRIAMVNAQTERLFGYTRQELLGQLVEVLIPDRFRPHHVQHRQRFSASPRSRPLGDHPELFGLRKDGSEFPAEISLSPLETEEGLVILAAVRDVTARKKAEEEIRRNLQIQSAVSSLLRILLEPISLEEQLQRILDLLFSIPWIALESKGAIFLVEDEPGVLVMKAQRGLPDELLTTCSEVPFGQCLCGEAAATGQTVFSCCLDARHETEYPRIKPHGHYCVPIVSRDRLHGVINVYVKSGHEKDPKEELFLSSVADALAGAIERRRAEEALRDNAARLLAAQRIQEGLLPAFPPSLRGFDVAGAMSPAEFAAGDYFDYFPMPGESLGLVIGDVSGHGFGPALLMASTHGLMHSLAQTQTDLSEILARANRFLAEETEHGRFVTLLLARLDLQTRTLVHASAGHSTGYVLDGSGAVKARLESTALPLAISLETVFPAGDPVTLEPGDLILLVTDGIQEAASSDGSLFGTRRILEVVAAHRDQTARQIIEALFGAVRQFSGGESLDDDITAVVVKVEATADGAQSEG